MAQHFELPDGRRLQYVFKGDTTKVPLLWWHGTPGAYLCPPGIFETCQKYGLSFIAFSRPGCGSSSRHKGRTVADTVDDAAALLKHLKVTKFYVGGWSGGGPYTLTTAARLPGCLAALCVAGIAPSDAEGLDWLAGQGEDNIKEFAATRQGEAALQKFLGPYREEMLKADLKNTMEALSSLLPPVDAKALLDDAELGQHLVDGTKASVEHSADGWADDDLAFVQPWGIDVADIKIPVILYQGEVDAMVPFAHGKWLVDHISKDCIHPYLLDGQGHISIYLGNVDAMIHELTQVAKQ